MEEIVILVNEKDEEIGYGEKLETHIRGQLHRAFSVFWYDADTDRLLLQKRACGKYHSGGLWSNTCCSHPLKGEDWEAAIDRCLHKELGVSLEKADLERKLRCVGKFQYCSRYRQTDNFEHEIDYVWIYQPDEIPEMFPFDQNEIEELHWVKPEQVDIWLKDKPEMFTSWFVSAYQLFRKGCSER